MSCVKFAKARRIALENAVIFIVVLAVLSGVSLPVNLPLGPTQQFCLCEDSTTFTFQIVGSGYQYLCATAVKPQIAVQSPFYFTGITAFHDSQSNLSIFNPGAPFLDTCDSLSPLIIPIDVGGFDLSAQELALVAPGLENGRVQVPSDGGAGVAKPKCRYSEKSGKLRNVAIYNASDQNATSTILNGFPIELRLETNRFDLVIFTRMLLTDTDPYVAVLTSLIECSAWLDTQAWTNPCRCPLLVIGNAISITSIIILVLFPVREVLAYRASRDGKEESAMMV